MTEPTRAVEYRQHQGYPWAGSWDVHTDRPPDAAMERWLSENLGDAFVLRPRLIRVFKEQDALMLFLAFK